MARTATCPSCGAPVAFQSASSIFAVCGYCQSTLIRDDETLRDLGKMAPLVEDRSPLQLGSEGHWRGVHFAIIGRIQIRYSQGTWNEWHLLFDDQRNGWLSEAAGEYVLTFLQQVQEPLPVFESLQPGQRLTVASRNWVISNLEAAECIAGEGELPFKVGGGYPVNAVDLRDGAFFATLDYSETPPLLFVGEHVDFAELDLRNLREGEAIQTQVAARVFRCNSCGNSLSPRSNDILAIACNQCGAVVDAADPAHAILTAAKLEAARYQPLLPIGSTGILDGERYEIIGYLVRRSISEGVHYDWREYLLVSQTPARRYRWLTEYDGHWNIVDVLSRPPGAGAEGPLGVRFEGKTYRHFATTEGAEVLEVAGEFTWRVQVGERANVTEYVLGEEVLAKEVTEREISWSRGVYVEPSVIASAFKPPKALPAPRGVYLNQPNPWRDASHRSLSLGIRFLLIASLLQFLFLTIFTGKTLLNQMVHFDPRLGEEVISQEFNLASRSPRLVVRNDTSLDNSWGAFDLMLVNKATGEAWPASREISYYHGYDDGYWWEGSNSDEFVFVDLPPGQYYLTIDAELNPAQTTQVASNLQVMTRSTGWSNLILLMLLLSAFPVIAWTRRGAFEAQRWMESDHVSSGSDSDDGDDD